MDTVRRVGHPASLYLVAVTLFAVSLLGLPQASLAGFGNDIATYDVKWSNPSPANGSFIKWTMSFGTLFPGEDPNGTGTGGLFAGNFPPILVETDVPPGVTGCCLLQGGALITLDQVQFFLSSTDPRCCVDFGNFHLLQRVPRRLREHVYVHRSTRWRPAHALRIQGEPYRQHWDRYDLP